LLRRNLRPAANRECQPPIQNSIPHSHALRRKSHAQPSGPDSGSLPNLANEYFKSTIDPTDAPELLLFKVFLPQVYSAFGQLELSGKLFARQRPDGSATA
jgi:hypothetical protein